jgi:hypothetical protein
MLDALVEARQWDALDRPVEAARAYKAAIRTGSADLEAYLDLAVLYFACLDAGYATHHRLGQEFLDTCNPFQELDRAQARFGPHPEIIFWRHYMRFIYLGEQPDHQLAAQLARSGEILVPCLLPLMCGPHPESHRAEGERLLDSVRNGASVRERYVRSVLESCLRSLDQRQHR